MLKKLISACLALMLLPAFACAEFKVHFLDVGEADCSIVQCDGQYMIIDGGNAEDSPLVYTYLKEIGAEELQYVIATHPHEDHIGGLAGAMNACRVHNLLSPVDSWSDGNRFKALLKYAGLQGVSLTVAKAGDSFTLGSAEVAIVSPSCQYDEVNNDSLVLRVTYQGASFLFAADAEKEAEEDMIASGADLRSTVLRVGHHGSNSSSTGAFLEAVSPQFAVISVGADNDNGHPTAEVLDRLSGICQSVLRTDEQGTIICEVSDGTISFSSLRTPTECSYTSDYIANINSMKFHRASCRGAKTTYIGNQIPVDSPDQAREMGFEPCGSCKP